MAAIVSRRARSRRRERVTVSAVQNGFFPRAFVWRGRQHDVRAVESCQTERRRGRVKSHRFRVRTEGGLLDLVQDLVRDLWQVERVVSVD
jgi:hypothetical protein